MRLLILPLLATTSLYFACSSGGGSKELPPRLSGVWYERPGATAIGCKMQMDPSGTGVFVGPVYGHDRTEVKGAFHLDGEVLYFKGDSAELRFQLQQDSSLAFIGDQENMRGLVMDHTK